MIQYKDIDPIVVNLENIVYSFFINFEKSTYQFNLDEETFIIYKIQFNIRKKINKSCV